MVSGLLYNTIGLNEFGTGVASVVQELGSLLGSLSHVALHTHLFTTMAAGLDMTYMKDKKTRPAIQDIIVQFIGVALRELDFGKARMFSELEMCKVSTVCLMCIK